MLLPKFLGSVKYTFSHTFELSKEFNSIQRQQIFNSLLSDNNQKKIDGFLDSQGSSQFLRKNQKSSFSYKNLINDSKSIVSSVGIGTYKGSQSEEDDLSMFNAIVDSVNMGVNVIDTCSNFRAGRSQRVIGNVLKYLLARDHVGGKYSRNQFLISSKAGYVDNQNLPKSLPNQQVINDHCVHPEYLQHSLQNSLQNMKISTLDVFYLNNFAETQLEQLGRKRFEEKLAEFFRFCEKTRKQQKIRYYGLSSWQSFRVPPTHSSHTNLQDIVKMAEQIGGKDHGFRFIQTPINVMMPEVFAEKNQPQGSLLETAEELKVNIVSNSPLLNGSLINIPLPAHKLKCRNNGAKHLQLIRSIPSSSLVCTLVGHKRNRHVKKNLEVMATEPLTQSQWTDVFFPSHNPAPIEAEQNDSEDEP